MLGVMLAGEQALPTSGRHVVLSTERLCRHVLLMGATGSGKSESALRLAWALAKSTDCPVFYIDGKGDRENAERFSGLMSAAGRRTRVFPMERFDGWRGTAAEIQGRLLEVIDFASEGPAAYYRDIARAVIALACTHPAGAPASSAQLLGRLDHAELSRTHGPASAASSLTVDQVRGVRLRYEAFFSQTQGALDGEWAWEDTDAAYLLLDSLAMREQTSALSRFLLEDFALYFSRRKPRAQTCVLIIDEYAALAANNRVASLIEQARGFNTALVLAPQVAAGLGDEREAERILGSVETVICHRVNTPEQIAKLAGTRRSSERSVQIDQGGPTGAGSSRMQHQFKVDPNQVRSLPAGEAFVISRGAAMRMRVTRAPDLRGELPEEAPLQVLPSVEPSPEPAVPPIRKVPF